MILTDKDACLPCLQCSLLLQFPTIIICSSLCQSVSLSIEEFSAEKVAFIEHGVVQELSCSEQKIKQ